MATHIESPERHLLKTEQRRGRKLLLTPEEEKRLRQELGNFKEEAPDLADFKGIYLSQELEADRRAIEELNQKFEQETTDQEKRLKFYGSVLELVICEFGNSWLPGYFSKASEYGDFKQGTDLVFETQDNDDEVLRIALDVTSDERKVNSKIERSFEDFSRGKFQKLKYFKSQLDDTRGTIEVFRLIIGTDLNKAVELAKLYLSEKNTTNRELRNKYREQIASNSFGRTFLFELGRQIQRILVIFEKLWPSAELYLKIEKLKKLKAIIEEQLKKAPEIKESEGQDRIEVAITESLARLKF